MRLLVRAVLPVLLLCASTGVLAAQTVVTDTAPATTPHAASAARALQQYAEACRRDGGWLWGVDLCGPIVLVDAQTRAAVANTADPQRSFERRDDLWFGSVPDDLLLANTAVTWQGRRWAMALLPLPDSAHDAVAMLAHESFHRVQHQLGVPLHDPPNPHLDERDGRLWLRLELRALSAALRSDGPVARRHVQNALLFRAARHAAYPGADSVEAALERSEGLAEYTGYRVASGEALAARRAAAALAAFERRPSFVRSLGYGTGPALGLLLDRYSSGWRTRVGGIESLSEELRRAVGIGAASLDVSKARIAAEEYGYAEVAAAEDALVAQREARIAAYRQALVDGGVLVLRTRNFSGSFDPNRVVPLGSAGTVYPTGTFMGEWGRIEVSGGALVAPDFQTITVAAPRAAPGSADVAVDGPGWRLELAEGWRVVPIAARPGSYEVRPRDDG